MPDWKRIQAICDNEAALAGSSLVTVAMVANARIDQERSDDEHDEFVARQLMFERIARLCLIIDDDAITGAINQLPHVENHTDPRIRNRDGFQVHWRAAYDYAVQQCGLIP